MTATMNEGLPNPIDDFRPVVRADVAVRRYGDEGVLWAPGASRPIYLDSVAALVLQLLDGSASVGELAEDVTAAIGIPLPVARTRLSNIVRELDAADALTTSLNASVHPPESDAVFPAPPNP